MIKSTLPAEFKAIVAALEQQFDENLLIVDITSDLAIPSFVVAFTCQDMLVQPQGFGASLSKALALKQALFEALQFKDRFNLQAQVYRQHTFAYLANYPLLLKAMKANFNELLEKQPAIFVEWQQIVSHHLDDNLDKQIQQMARLLVQKGANIYTQVLYESSTGVTMTYVLIPELESFALIRDGKFCAIKDRGLGVVHAD